MSSGRQAVLQAHDAQQPWRMLYDVRCQCKRQQSHYLTAMGNRILEIEADWSISWQNLSVFPVMIVGICKPFQSLIFT